LTYVYDDDDYHPLEADREYRHEIAHDYGTYPSGEPLPRHTDKHGRVRVTCTCGSKFVLKAPPGETETAELPEY
jgi:hypothetical protein